MANIQQHPHYHEGFFDALDGYPIFDDCTPEYRAGWEAAWESKRIFKEAGFTQSGRDFSASAIISEDTTWAELYWSSSVPR